MRGGRARVAAFWCAVLVALSGAAFAADDDRGLIGTWSFNAGSAEQVLKLEAAEPSSDSDLSGKLGGVELTGFVAGGEIVLRGDGVVLLGWFGRDADGTPFMAGRQRLSSGGVDRVTGWYAVPAAVALKETPADTPEAAAADAREERVQFFDFAIPDADTQTSQATAGSPPAASPSTARQGDGSFSGTWKAADGLYRIEQEGSRLTVLKPSGETVGGRQTGAGILMVGLRVGCCRGELTAPGVIEWQDGAVWRRSD